MRYKSLSGFALAAFMLIALALVVIRVDQNFNLKLLETHTPIALPSPPSPETPLKFPLSNPRLVVKKAVREMSLYDGDSLLRTYHIGLGSSPVEDKVRAGDKRTPEGDFYVCVKNANSKFYLSLGLSYPNAEDAERGLKDGLISLQQRDRILRAIEAGVRPPWDTPLGGEIFIHGNGSSSDWTWGCVAVEDAEMRELFDAVPMGARVRILH
jgi:murein L,D-transpeptidase YafK